MAEEKRPYHITLLYTIGQWFATLHVCSKKQTPKASEAFGARKRISRQYPQAAGGA